MCAVAITLALRTSPVAGRRPFLTLLVSRYELFGGAATNPIRVLLHLLDFVSLDPKVHSFAGRVVSERPVVFRTPVPVREELNRMIEAGALLLPG